jgi:tetratricopeptide (TPR) repeat protein
MDRTPLVTVRFAPRASSRWQGSIGFLLCGLALSLGLVTPESQAQADTTPSPKPSGATSKSSSANPSVSSSSSVPISTSAAPEPQAPARLIFADPFPSPYQKPESDLLLNGTSELQAQAMEWFVLGSVLEDRGEAASALEFYKRSLGRDPSHISLALRVASALGQGQQYAEALQLLKDTATAAPSDPSPLVEVARIYLNGLRQPDNALTYAEKAYRLAPHQFQPLAILVEVCSTAKLTQKLEDLLKRTETTPVSQTQYWLSAGDLFRNAFSLRSNQLTRPILERINGLFRKAIDQSPLDSKAFERCADHFTLTRQFPEASAFYEQAHRLFKSANRQASSPQICQKWAKSLLLNEQVEPCLEVLENLIREQPSLASAREFAGELYLQQGQLIAALGHLSLALESDPSDLADHLRVAQLQLRLKRYPETVATARRAQKLFPDSPNLSMLLAISLSEMRQMPEAVRAFEAAERQYQTHDREGLNASFYMTFGAAAERAGLLEKASALLQKSIALDPDNAAEPLNYLGYLWVDRNQNLEEAGQLIRKALQLRPNQPAYLDSLGWWHFRRGEYAEAEKRLRQALETIRREEAAEVYDHLGEVLEKLNRPAEALAAWEAALEIDPNLPGIPSKLQRLRPKP